MEDVQDEPLAAERVAGIDIGKAMVMATIRVPGAVAGGRRRAETREFATTRQGLLALAAWLREWDVERAGMESTSNYWKPVLFTLEREGIECLLYLASRVKAMPGRPKTDKLDSAWLARLTEQGAVPGSFIPPEPIRVLRSHTRYRRHLVQDRTAEKQRVEKLLEEAHLKLSCVLTDIHGKSGRAMLEAIIAGERDPQVLAGLALGRARRKAAQLREALDCTFFTSDHAWLLQVMLARIDQYTAEIAQLTTRIGELCQPWERQLAQLATIPGFSERTAQDLIAETGVDMTRFPTAAHLASWARQAPAVSESAGHRKNKGTGRGNPYSGGTLGEAATAASRTQTFLGARYHRLIRHMPKAKAQRAIMRAILVITWHLLSDPEATYNDLGHDYYDRHDDEHRKARHHARALERLGYTITITRQDDATTPGARAS